MMEERETKKKERHVRLRFRGRPTGSRRRRHRRRRQFGLTKPDGGGNETPHTLSYTRWMVPEHYLYFVFDMTVMGNN
jgi:hypothetical protein